MTEGRARTGNIKSIYLLLPAYRAPMQVKNFLNILRIFNFGVQLRLTRIRSDLVTAQVDRPIILESTLNDSALYL